ncbi:MAG: LeuA family protein [Salinirussus sp.]
MKLKDVTLREAAQMPDRSYTGEQRREAGRHLDRLGPAFVQAGFPATGPPDPAVVGDLAECLNAQVTALARPLDDDVDAALDAGADVVDLFAPLSDRQLTHSLGTSREEVLAMLAEARDRVATAGATPHVSLVDAFRTDPEHLVAFCREFPDVPVAGLADTVGCRTPDEVESFLVDLADRGVDLSRVAVHFHDDIGVATANVLAAAGVGVGYADVSVASLGERAGNPPIEEVVVAGYRSDGETFGTDHGELVPACEAALDALGEAVPPRKAILGEAVTTHEAGIHTEAMLSEPSTFEPFDPATFGGERTLLFGPGTGESGAAALLDRAGVDGDPAAFRALLEREGPLTRQEAVALARREFG